MTAVSLAERRRFVLFLPLREASSHRRGWSHHLLRPLGPARRRRRGATRTGAADRARRSISTRPTVIVLDRALIGERRRAIPNACASWRRVPRWSPSAMPAKWSRATIFRVDLLDGYLPATPDPATIIAMLRGAFRHAASLVAERTCAGEGRRATPRELAELTSVGVALIHAARSASRCSSMILTPGAAHHVAATPARSISPSAPRPATPPTTLRFKLSQNFTLPALPLHRVHRPDRSREPRRLRGGNGRAARHRRRLPAARRRRRTSRTAASTRSSAIAPSRCS